MKLRAFSMALLAGAAGLALSFDHSDRSSVAEASFLRDSLTGRSLCRGGSKAASTKFRLRLASALAGPEADTPDGDVPPLYEGLGDFSYPVTSANAEAQAYFDQGLKFTYAFNHYEAVRAFKAAQSHDPACAMCYWGEALALGPNINAPMMPDAVPQAWAALTKAKELAGGASAKEQALINALAARYAEDPEADRAALDGAFADAMVKVAGDFDADDHIQVIAAEAIMTSQPWDYWNADGTPKGRVGTALALVEKVLERSPNHGAAIHLYIHLTEASPDPKRARPHADRLGALSPAAGHLVHMPAHTYFRIGDYKASLDANIEAAAADERYLEANQGSVMYRYGYYPHNVHFILTSAQGMGAREQALNAANKLAGLLTPEILSQAPWIQPIAVAPLMAEAQFGAVEEVLATERPDDAFPFLLVHWHYARAQAQIMKGNLVEARKHSASIRAIGNWPSLAALGDFGLPATAITELADHLVRGRIAWASGELDLAVEHLEEAAEIQDEIPYMEPPYWYYPVAQTLGAVYLEAERFEEAEAAFRRALAQAPNNGWALYGLSKTYERMGKPDAAREAFALYENAWVGDAAPQLKHL